MPLPDGPFRARVGERAFPFDARGGTLHEDGRPVEAALEPLGGAAYLLRVGARVHRVVVEGREGDRLTLALDGQRVVVEVDDARRLTLERFGFKDAGATAARELRAPMPGLVREVGVAPGDAVEVGQRLLVLEAMKMENELKAAHAGVVARVHVGPGEAVSKGALLVEFAA